MFIDSFKSRFNQKKKKLNEFLCSLSQQTINEETIKQMFNQHNNHRFVQGLVCKSTSPTLAVRIIASKPLNIKAIIGWTTCSIGVSTFIILALLLIFQESKKRRVLQNNTNTNTILIAKD